MDSETIRKSDQSSDYRRNELQRMQVAPPLDLSFQKATDLRELEVKRAQTTRTGRAPIRTSEDRFMTSSLWLSNNLFTSMDGLLDLAKRTLDSYACLSWIDLSFNQIGNIGDEISLFSNLKILYFHGNNLSNITDIMKLKKLEKLKTLTLHGNPIENFSNYRGYIMHILPQLTTLDFSPILLTEKKRVVPAGFASIIRHDT